MLAPLHFHTLDLDLSVNFLVPRCCSCPTGSLDSGVALVLEASVNLPLLTSSIGFLNLVSMKSINLSMVSDVFEHEL